MSSNYMKCPACKEWGFERSHKCKPVFHVTELPEEADEDSREVRAYDAEAAAAADAYGESIDAEMYDTLTNDGIEVSVFDPTTQERSKFRVTGEFNLTCHARDLE